MLLWVIFRANSDAEIYFGSSAPQFCWERWCRLLSGVVLCSGEQHWLLRRAWRTLAQHRLSHLITGDVLGGIYVVWILMSITGDCSFSTPSCNMVTPVWRHLSLPSTLEEARVLFWQLTDAWSRVKSSHPLVMGEENPESAVGTTYLAWVLGGEELLWGSLDCHCPENGVMLPFGNEGNLKAWKGQSNPPLNHLNALPS